MAWKVLTFLLVLAFVNAVLGKAAYKHLAGGPKELLPPADPSSATVDSHIRLLRSFILSGQNNILSEVQSFVVDSSDFTFVVLCSSDAHLDAVEVTFTSPSGKTSSPTVTSSGPFGLGGRTYPSLGLYFGDVEHGQWTASIVIKRTGAIKDEDVKAFSFVTFSDGESPVSVKVSSNTLNTVVGSTVQLSAVVADPTVRRDANGTLLCKRQENQGIDNVELLIRHPSGKTTREQMHEDSIQSNDATPVFSAGLALAEMGSYQTEVVVQGERCNGRSYERSAWYWVTAVEQRVSLTGIATVTPSMAEYHRNLKAEQLTVNLLIRNVKGSNDVPASPPYRVYAEIFSGLPSDLENSVPLAWIGGLSDISEVLDMPALSLHLDTSWLQGHTGPFFLRNVRVEELDTYSAVSSMASMALPLPEDTVLRLSKMEPVEVITKEMRHGYHVGRPRQNQTSSSSAEGTLLLVHGYCAPNTPYTVGDFTNYRIFQDFKKSRGISEFAQLVAEFGAEHDSFGVVGHSQGGLAVLDMYTFFDTGLDRATGDRRIQTLASPWRGSPLSGLLAIIGDLLGIGCGDNKDMSYDGAAKWLAGIPMANRQEVYFYTGQYATGNLINYCILAANAVLSWPNDGMIEQSHSLLDGGNNMGHSKGQCHSVDMRNPPIAHNSERNKLMDSLAAR